MPALASAHAHRSRGRPHRGCAGGGLACRGHRRGEGRFEKPLTLVVNGTVELHPSRLATAYIKPAVGYARSASPGTNVKLVVAVRGSALRATVAVLERRFNKVARDAQLRLVDGKPWSSPT